MATSIFAHIVAALYAASFVSMIGASDFSIDSSHRMHARGSPVKRDTRCGTWAITCAGAGMYAIVSTTVTQTSLLRTAQVSTTITNKRNQVVRLGMEASATLRRSVRDFTTLKSLSPMVRPLGIQPATATSSPMAGMAQDDFKNVPAGTIRNSLCCIRADDNSFDHNGHAPGLCQTARPSKSISISPMLTPGKVTSLTQRRLGLIPSIVV
nr:hypothetical protein CFP56_09482 [Quercus suber]